MKDAFTRPRGAVSAAWSSVVVLASATLLTLAFTLAITAVAALVGRPPSTDLLLTPERARAFAGPEWFHGRPSAAGGTVSGGSNLGPTNPALGEAVAGRVAAIRAENPAHVGPIPVDLVTAGASGFDPHLSPAAARLQIARVAAARGLDEGIVLAVVDRSVESPAFGLIGHPRVNVIRLNAAVASLAPPNADADAPRP